MLTTSFGRFCIGAIASWMSLVAHAADVPAGKVKVRPVYEAGRVLRYRLKLSGATAWAPAVEGIAWGKMQTDFTFALRTKALRESGACTFELLGEHLRSTGEGEKGAFGVDATRERTLLKVKDRWQVSVDRSPLAAPMTMTFGPLGGYRFGTGLLPVGVYLLPGVDHRFWTVLTLAPLGEVAPGEKWAETFHLPVPGAKGKPLELAGKWQVVGWETWRKRKVLAMSLEAELALKDSELMLKNGDVVHVASGSYKAEGKVGWDVAHGVLCFAEAKQKILVRCDGPAPRALRSEAECALELLAASKPPARP